MLILLACAADPSGASPDSGADDGDSGGAYLDEGVELAPVQECAAPVPSVSFAESGEAWGFQVPVREDLGHEEGPSIAVGDVDSDGHDDVVITNFHGNAYYYRNNGAGFDLTDLDSRITPGLSVILFDADGDGDPDLLTGGAFPSETENDNGMLTHPRFLPSLPSSVDGDAIFTHDFSPGDLDGDGVAEFYMPLTHNFRDPDVPYDDLVMRGDHGTFAYDTEVVPMDVGARQGLDAVWFDADGDLDEDVYVVNDFGMLYGASTLLRNESGALTSAEDECFCSMLTNAKGVDVGDFNGDGRADILVSANPSDALLSQLADGSYVDVTLTTNAAAIDTDATGWGGIFLDYDNDGQPDILPAQGDRWNAGNDHPHFDAPLKLLHQENGVFQEVSASLGMVADSSFRAVSASDFNEDGVLDLIVTSMEERPLFYLSDGCTEAGWLDVAAPIGATVRVEAGGKTQTNWIKTDAGYQSHRPARAHFGLGSAQVVDSLTVTLVDGTTLRATAFDARRRVTVGG